MKKQKLNLNKLKVTSFTTSGSDKAAQVKGGNLSGFACDPTANTFCFVCPPFTAEKTCDPTDATNCFICPPYTEGEGCKETGQFVC